MPAIVRKLLVFAAIDGLILQPLPQKNQRTGTPLKIEYTTHAIGPLLHDVKLDELHSKGVEVAGVIGLLKVASSAYLISISKRHEVARIWGRPVYVITGVTLVPIESQTIAQAAIDHAKHELSLDSQSDEAADVSGQDFLPEPDNDFMSTDDSNSITDSVATRSSSDQAGNAAGSETREAGIAEEVIHKKGAYGRFAERWFSKQGWSTGRRMPGPRNSDEDLAYPEPEDVNNAGSERQTPSKDGNGNWKWPQQTPSDGKTIEETLQGSSSENLTASLLPKLVNTTKLLFASRTFYYSYDLDITHRTPAQRQSQSDLPLYKDVDSQYFWNNNLSKPFIERGFNEYILPVMQGFVGQRNFALQATNTEVSNPAATQIVADAPEKAVEAAVQDVETIQGQTESVQARDSNPQRFVLTLVSRRSTNRAGLRYLRRGIDEDGHTANAVETEQILSFPEWDPDEKMHSFVQTRGSIPLFFSQIPYTFKPPPALHGSQKANQDAMTKHFSNLSNLYGEVQAISLVDKHGGELSIGEAYEKNIELLNNAGGVNGRKIGFDWFEFHKACKGMKFENVSMLVDSMAGFLSNSQWTILQANKPVMKQSGILRSNCMDCLDRTNVVQSAFAQRILELQLATLGFHVNLTSDLSTTWFNTLWADNGDAISRAYTGTSALKGDYTRTRKRNMVGALTDLSLTLSRYYYNLFDDFFAQAAIDFLLGTVTSTVFAEFEATMTTADPAIDIEKARQAGIATAAHVVIEESEDLIHGWVLRSPAIPNTLRTFPFVEAILLLTDKALYSVRFDWDASKVQSFERIDLCRVQGLQQGTYIIETHTHSQTDSKLNVGFVVKYNAFELKQESGEEANEKVVAEEPPGDAMAAAIRPTIIRVNSQALDNVRDAWSITGSDGHLEEALEGADDAQNTRILAFKAPPPRSTVARKGDAVPPLEQENIRTICSEIATAADNAKRALVQSSSRIQDYARASKISMPTPIEIKDVIGIGKAKASTGYLERMGWEIKRTLWGWS